MPKLQMIGGGVKHYAYTPAGKKQYLQDKANLKGMKKMQPSMGLDSDDACLPYVYKDPKAAKRKRPSPKEMDQSKKRKLDKPKKKSMGGPSWGEFPKPTK